MRKSYNDMYTNKTVISEKKSVKFSFWVSVERPKGHWSEVVVHLYITVSKNEDFLNTRIYEMDFGLNG